MDLQIIIRTLPDDSEVVDECEFERAIGERNRVLLLGHARGLVSVTGDEPGTRCLLRLKMDFQVRHVVVDRYVLLNVQSTFNQHKLSRPAIRARNESHLGKWNELIDC